MAIFDSAVVELLNGAKESVDVCPGRLGRNVAAGGDAEVGSVAAALENIEGCLAYRLRSAVADLTCGVNVTHNENIGGSVGDHLGEGNSVAEVVSHCAAGEDGVGHQVDVVAAVVVNKEEVLILNSVNDLLNIGSGELCAEVWGEHTCEGLGHNNAVCTNSFVSLDVLNEEVGALSQNSVNHVGLSVAENHSFADIEETACERIRSDNACEDGAVGNEFLCLADSFDVDAGAGGTDFGDGELLGLVLIGNDGADNSGNFVIGETDGGTKSLGLNRKVHKADSCGSVNAVSDHLHTLCLAFGAGDEFADGDSHELDGGEGENGGGLFLCGGDHLIFPCVHVHSVYSFH